MAYLLTLRFRWECLTSHPVSPVPAPATSNGACGFPALRFPADFTARFMRPTATAPLPGAPSATIAAATPPRGSDSAFPEQYSRRRSVLQTTKRHYQPLLPPPFLTTTCRQQGPFARRALPRVCTTTAPSATRSSPRRFPGGSGYTASLPPGPFALGRDGLLQLLGVSCVSVLPVAPRRWSLTRQPVCVSPYCLRPRRSGSALGTCGSRGTIAVRLRCGPDTRSPPHG